MRNASFSVIIIANIFALIGSVCWAIFEPGFEPIITSFAFTASLIGLFIKENKADSITATDKMLHDEIVNEARKEFRKANEKRKLRIKRVWNFIIYLSVVIAVGSIVYYFVPTYELIKFIFEIIRAILLVFSLSALLYIVSFYVGFMILFHYHNLECKLLKDITDWAGYKIYRELMQIEGFVERIANIDKYIVRLPQLAYQWYKYGDETWKELLGDIHFNKSKPDIDLDDVDTVLALANQKEQEGKRPLAIFAYFKAKSLLERKECTTDPLFAKVLLSLSKLLREEADNKDRKLPFYFRLLPHIKEFEDKAKGILESQQYINL